MGKQPGVMLYFDLRNSLARLSYEEKGRILEAVLDYGQYGVVPEFDGMLGLAWDFISPRVDHDKTRYEEVSRRRSEAAASRWNQAHANASFAMQTMPTTNTNTKTSTKTNTQTKTSTQTSTPSGPQPRRGHWAPVVPIEQEIEEKNRLARMLMNTK